MQTQDAPAEIIFKLWPWLEANQKRLVGIGVAIVIAVGVYFLLAERRAQREVEAGQALTQLQSAPLAPALAQLAVRYAGTAAAERAALQAATTWYAAGSYEQAQAQFDKLVSAQATGALAATANLGLAASLEAQGKLDLAAEKYRKVMVGFKDSSVAIAAKFSLARVLAAQGKLADALNYYSEVARAPLAGSFGSEAGLQASEIKSKLAASAQPKAK